jgi:hypothetical protein
VAANPAKTDGLPANAVVHKLKRNPTLRACCRCPVADRLADLAQQLGHRATMAEWIALLDKLKQSFEVAIQAMAID